MARLLAWPHRATRRCDFIGHAVSERGLRRGAPVKTSSKRISRASASLAPGNYLATASVFVQELGLRS